MSIQVFKQLVYSLPKPIIFSIGAICGIATIAYIANNLSKYSATLPKEIQERVTDSVRIKRSLVGSRVKKLIPPDELTISMLGDVAREVNASMIHCSGNCMLLSRCILYNLQHGATILATRNVFPIYESIHSTEVEKVIFGADLTEMPESLKNLQEVEQFILNHFQQMGERFYIVDVYDYTIPLIGASGAHAFNAVVLFDTSKRPYVQFVDAWKTSDYTPKTSVLESRYHNGLFVVSVHPPRPEKSSVTIEEIS